MAASGLPRKMTMTVSPDRIAVIGSSPFAVFLSGLLATGQTRDVALVRDPDAEGRLPDGIDLGFAPHTRPDTLSLLARLVPEAQRLLSRFPVPVLDRSDLLLGATGHPAREALAHMTHVAAGFGLPLEPMPGENPRRIRVRDVRRLRRAAFLAAGDGWLAARGVRQVHGRNLAGIGRDGSATIAGETYPLAILADDTAALAYGVEADLTRLGRFVPHATLLTEPVPPLAATPLTLDLDSGAILRQRASGALQIIGPFSASALPAGFSDLIGQHPLRLAGRAEHMRFVSHDGAPVLGAPRRGRATVLLGLGPDALMFAPMLARWIAGAASEPEAQWCAAHGATRSARSPAVAEFAPVRAEA